MGGGGGRKNLLSVFIDLIRSLKTNLQHEIVIIIVCKSICRMLLLLGVSVVEEYACSGTSI